MKILIIDDSALVRSILKKLFERVPELVVAGEAANGQRAVELNRELAPDLILMDVNMPVMDGLEATRRIMGDRPVPIMIFSNRLDAETGYEAINAGAMEVMAKPDISQFNEPAFYEAFLDKIRTLAGAKVLPRPGTFSRRNHRSPEQRSFQVVVMGASTGGPLAVKEILQRLPGNFPVGIVLVQHMEPGFDQGFARWLDDITALNVRLAGNRESLSPGHVHVAPVDRHLKLSGTRLLLDDGDRVLNQKPSVDVLFRSAADAFGEGTLAVLLTGMGRDGAEGCRSVVGRGGVTLVQDEGSSAIFGMPRSAIELGAASQVLPLSEIPGRIVELLRRPR